MIDKLMIKTNQLVIGASQLSKLLKYFALLFIFTRKGQETIKLIYTLYVAPLFSTKNLFQSVEQCS